MTSNVWFKRVRQVLRLSRRDVCEVMRLGGDTVTPSQVDGWARHPGDDRAGKMGVEQFDRFTQGLVEWARGPRQPKEGAE